MYQRLGAQGRIHLSKGDIAVLSPMRIRYGSCLLVSMLVGFNNQFLKMNARKVLNKSTLS